MKTKTKAKTPKRPKKLPVELLPRGTVLERRVLSLDVSSTAAGWALWNPGGTLSLADFGLIKPPSNRESWERADLIVRGLREVLDSHRLGATFADFPLICMEWQSPYRAAGCRNANGLAVLGQAQGIVRQSLQRDAWDHVELISERLWTKENGWPVKKELRAMKIRVLFPDYARKVENDELKDDGFDVADAIGVGVWRLSQ